MKAMKTNMNTRRTYHTYVSTQSEVRVVAVYSEAEVRYLVGSVEYVWFVTSFAASNFKLLFSLIRPVDDRVNEYNG